MTDKLTIGEVARRTGVPITTIRFYEADGVIPPPPRTASGYRVYSATDVRRLRLARRARLLGLALPEVRSLVNQAFRSDCLDFGEQLLRCIAARRAEIDRHIAELRALTGELNELEQQVRHDQQVCRPGQQVAECGCCPMIDEEGGETDGCRAV